MTVPLEVEQLMSRLTGDDWDFMNVLEERYGISPEARKKRELAKSDAAALAAAASRIFDSSEGDKVLEWLLDQTLRRLTFNVMIHPDPAVAQQYGVFREGQNAMALSLLGLIAKGRSEAPPSME